LFTVRDFGQLDYWTSVPLHPPLLGLTGPPGAGKSTVARELGALGCVVSDSDALARAAFDDPEIRRTILRWWGERVLCRDGIHGAAPQAPPPLDRRAIADLVFAAPAERARLEALIHPWIARQREALFATAPEGTPALVIDAALLLETGLGSACDSVILVDCPLELRRSRVKSSRSWSAAELARREAAQWPLERKRASANFEVRTDCDLPTLRHRVAEVLRLAIAKQHG
jgi:dephospho-CoA kinase